jgi:esterase/lipase
MNVIIIPGFIGHPDEITFQALGSTLESKGHTVTKIAWPHLPDNLPEYSFSKTIAHAQTIIGELDNDNLALLGFSMGGIVAALLATEFKPQKLGLIVSPYQAGSADDLAGKYKDWQESGWREVISSRFGKLDVPFSFIIDAQKYNALEYMPDVHCPVLFVVGEKDDKVPMAVTRKLFEKTHEPKVWHQISGMEHKYQYQPEILNEVNRIIVEFVSR